MRTTIARAMIFAACASLAACAESHTQKRHHPHSNGRQGHDRPQFAQLDKNNDGYITRAEVSAKRWERLRRKDADADKRVSREEYRRHR